MKPTNKPRTLQVSCVQLHWGRPLEYNLERSIHYLRLAAREGSRVVCFPEASLTGYYFPYLFELPHERVQKAIETMRKEAATARLWVIAGAIHRTAKKFLNMAHVISPEGRIVHEYAKVHLAGRSEQKYCRPGNKLSLFELDGVLCTIAICRDGRHPEVYRLPAMAGARILFHPSCSSDELEAVVWKRTSGRAQLPAGPTTHIFHCVANTIGQSPDGRQSSSGQSFIRDPSGLPLAEAGYYQEEMITAILELDRATGCYALDSLRHPQFLRRYWQQMISEVRRQAGIKPR